MKKAILITLMLSGSQAFALRWDGANHPNNFARIAGTNLITDYNALPIKGKLSDDRLAWSETYWPSNLGGISYRWSSPNPQPFTYKLHTKEELQKMSMEELSRLSPSELYDIAQGDYSYSLTRKARSLYTKRDLWWEGICHGWSQAAANYPEPRPVNVINPDGIRVPFGSSDVKGLLAMHEAYNYKGNKFGFVGKRCKVRGKVVGEEDERDGGIIRPSAEDAASPDCSDVNAGAFHVVVANMIGIHSKSFVADVDRFNDVWNQPIHSYESQVLSDTPVADGNGVARKIRIATKFIYGEELQVYTPARAAEKPEIFWWQSKQPVTGTPSQQFRSKDYEYILELDANNRIVGGEWVSETRPDFMWMYARSPKFKSSVINLTGLNAIYRPVER